MERNRPAVKKSRSYDSSRRQEQARLAREAILEAARRRFLDDGYGATTIAAIAGDAGVSVDTIYKSFGGKPGLVRAIYERGLAGAGPVHAESRSDELQRREPDAREIIRGFGRFVTEIAPRGAPVMLLIRDAAATDPEMGALLTDIEAQRLARMRHNAENLIAAGHLRTDLTVDRAAEIMWFYTAAELYERLVLQRGWPVDEFGTFVADALTAALLPPATGRPRRGS